LGILIFKKVVNTISEIVYKSKAINSFIKAGCRSLISSLASAKLNQPALSIQEMYSSSQIWAARSIKTGINEHPFMSKDIVLVFFAKAFIL